jgi:hypothetical protein
MAKQMAVSHTLAGALALALACTGAAATAHAFSSPDAYGAAAAVGGGGGRWFSGSPADGFGCSVCHSAAAGERHFPLYVAGLDGGSYELSSQREVILSWPEFAQRWVELRPDPMAAPVPDQPAPALGLVAEFVAESGQASGTILVSTASANPSELCERTRPNLQPRTAVKLYQVRPRVDPVLIKPDAMGVLRCDAQLLGQRCIIALSSCGAQQIRFTWVAPATLQGPIWFSAGFVATDALSGTFEHDSVEEVALALVPAGTPGALYRAKLQSACAVSAVASGPWPTAAVLVFMCWCSARLGRRRSVRRVRERS